uniref:Uncharacterized protein n=1 Tax=Myoviridae sp. ctzwE5 TaxID=2825214 RepID=A0A8S5PX97_9CAUD|nr:MAG TPA: hypothetical protein [Myoviridae sp. ctzwE5]
MWKEGILLFINIFTRDIIYVRIYLHCSLRAQLK